MLHNKSRYIFIIMVAITMRSWVHAFCTPQYMLYGSWDIRKCYLSRIRLSYVTIIRVQSPTQNRLFVYTYFKRYWTLSFSYTAVIRFVFAYVFTLNYLRRHHVEGTKRLLCLTSRKYFILNMSFIEGLLLRTDNLQFMCIDLHSQGVVRQQQ